MSATVQRKIRRLRGGSPHRFLDLFGGCGGIAVGFQRAGCHSLGGVELDEHASRSYATNFHSEDSAAAFETHAAPKDITQLD
ncbi:MAG: DNA cytosine methyltransferase, partial [Armatimonadetes bacterium]|nr:DNA cytosine methyltransferase [Armatimonadota bacterium]